MKLAYDFHIHTALSPCGSNDMTPNNIVNMCILKGLDVIAITDHNTCGNVEAVMKVAKETDLIVIAGMEVETSEEIHVVCLFPTLAIAKIFEKVVFEKLPNIKNREDIFGEQLLLDEEDEVIGKQAQMLITATQMDLYTLVKEVSNLGGVAIPAHVDRTSYSIISNLGFVPPDLNIKSIEFSKNVTINDFLKKHSYLQKYHQIFSSDAHYLEDISEKNNFLTMDQEKKVTDVTKILKLI